MAAVSIIERKFPPHFEVRGGWFRFWGRLAKTQPTIDLPSGSKVKLPMGGFIFRLEATVEVAKAKKKIRRLTKILQRTTLGVGTIIIWFVDPTRGWCKQFIKTLRNSPEGLRALLRELRSFLEEAPRQETVWDALEVWGRVSKPAHSQAPAYGVREFNEVFNRMLLACRARDRALARLARWGKALRADIEARRGLLEELRAKIARGWGRTRDYSLVSDLEEEIGILKRELEKARAAYARLVATTPVPVKNGRVDWGKYKAQRREWFEKLCNPPSRGGVDLPPSRIGGEEEVSAFSLREATGLWGEEHQSLEGLRLHHLQDLVQP